MRTENWKPIPGYEGKYQISDEGRVYSEFNHRLRKLQEDSDGYLGIHLNKDGIPKYWHIHVLVAKAFISNPFNLPEVNHKDLNRKNNKVNNLEWVTRKENVRHAAKSGSYAKRFTEDDIRYIRSRHQEGISGYKLAKEFNVEQQTIYDILNGRTWKDVK